jgi:SAM-dependent methyltransferase
MNAPSALVPRVRRAARRTLERLGLLGPFYRAAERRVARQAGPWAPEADGLPTPSPLLVTLVAGHADLEGFLAQGRHLQAFLSRLAERAGQPFAAEGTVLDFGCGCGRLARFTAPEVIAAGGRFLGVDINPELVGWCDRSLPGDYRLNRLDPPAPIETGSVRLLYAVSVFTHLTRAKMAAWLADYARVLAPGGVALVSFADEDRATPELRARLAVDGFAASTAVLEGSNYMASYAAAGAFAALCAEHLEVVEIVPSARSGETLAWAVLRKPG